MIEVLLVGLGAGTGAALRFLSARRWDGELPWGTLAVNVAGSFALGFFVGVGVTGGGLALLGTGFAGGLTTYSAFAVQTQALASGGRAWGASYAAVTVSVSFLAGTLGWLLGSFF